MISVVLEIAIVLAATLLLAAAALVRGLRLSGVAAERPAAPNIPLERIAPYRPDSIAVRYGGGRGPHDTHLN